MCDSSTTLVPSHVGRPHHSQYFSTCTVSNTSRKIYFILSKRSPTLPNPNATRNRVPNERELQTLRSIAKSKSDLAESIQRRILEARAAHEEALERFRAQQLVLDALLSEVHTTKQFVDVLETQKKSLEDEMNDIRGLLNPIRSLPAETLSHIFTMTVEYRESKDWTHRDYSRNACRITRVCRRWRDVALQCPALWTSIFVDVTAEPSIIEALWTRSVQRVKQSPAFVRLSMTSVDHIDRTKQKGVGYLRRKLSESLQMCDLRRLPSISTLWIETSEYVGLAPSLSLITRFPSGKLRHLKIEGFREDAVEWWSWSKFLKQFPRFDHLTIKGAEQFSLDDSTQFPEITRLSLVEHYACPLPDLLLATPNLEHLHIGPMLDQSHYSPLASEYTFPNLKSLYVDQSFSFSWDVQVDAPNLSFFSLDTDEGGLNEDFLDLLASSQSVTTVVLNTYDPFIMPLAEVSSNLLHLTIQVEEWHLLSLIRWEGASPPFPKLQTLALCYRASADEVPAFHYFDELVAKRCVPPSVTAVHESDSVFTPIQALTIQHDGNIQPTWMDSIHYQAVTARVFDNIEDGSLVTLSWILEVEELVAVKSGKIGIPKLACTKFLTNPLRTANMGIIKEN